jgi:hypothetical protein
MPDEYLLSRGFIQQIEEGFDVLGMIDGDDSETEGNPVLDNDDVIMVEITEVYLPEEDPDNYYPESGRVAQFKGRQVTGNADGTYKNLDRIFDIDYPEEDLEVTDIDMPYNLFGLDLDFTPATIANDLSSYVGRIVTATFMPITIADPNGGEDDIDTEAYCFSKVGSDGSGANFGYWTATGTFNTRTLPAPEGSEEGETGDSYAVYTGQTVSDDWFIDVPNGLEPSTFSDQTVVIKNLGNGAFRMTGHNFQVVRGNWVDPDEEPEVDPETGEDLPLTILSVWICQAPIFY